MYSSFAFFSGRDVVGTRLLGFAEHCHDNGQGWGGWSLGWEGERVVEGERWHECVYTAGVGGKQRAENSDEKKKTTDNTVERETKL